jgi:hypothetical protein
MPDTAWICMTCGTQFPPTAGPPATCPICTDERQYVPDAGQRWTTLDALRTGHRNTFQRIEPGLLGIGTVPSFAIGQRALLLECPGGNVLWDCIALLDDATADIITALGGLSAIAISHPHYYTTMVEWGRAFDCPVYLHAADREHVVRPDPLLRFWEGETDAIGDGLTLIRCGGHFAGGTVLHWAGGAGGRGALLSGDIVQVIPDRRFVSFMWSYPNLIPLPARAIDRIAAALEPYEFERIYGAWWDAHVMQDGKAAVMRSAARYRAAIQPPAARS